eukprot:3549724-Karenia_brevis.AAC.1
MPLDIELDHSGLRSRESQKAASTSHPNLKSKHPQHCLNCTISSTSFVFVTARQEKWKHLVIQT